MPIIIVKNKYLNALLLLMLFSAIIHMVVLFYITISAGNIYLLNYFNILSLDYFSPGIFDNLGGNIIATVTIILIYIVILKVNRQT